MDNTRIRNFAVVSHDADIPRELPAGMLIPSARRSTKQAVAVAARAPFGVRLSFDWSFGRVAIIFLCSLMISLTSVGFAGYQSIALARPDTGPLLPAVPEGESLYAAAQLQYGIQVALSQPDFFEETRKAFIAEGRSFIEANLAAMEIRYYQDGKEVFFAPIGAKGKEGSWWETPAGLYEIGTKQENHFSSFGAVYQPWSMTFQGNFFIHGWPYYPDGTPVESSFSGGCIRLDNESAEALYNLVSVGTPVLVHEADFVNDAFVYEPKIPELKTPHYLIADIQNSTVLAASDLDEVVPIASVTKLMTALIAVEYINLDKDVTISYVPDVPSVIPRLQVGQRVSMYSLLQLLLVESSNEASEFIAGIVGRERFIKLMNDKAKALGLTETTFADPSGLSSGNQSSLGDLLRLSQYIYNNRSFILELTANQDIPTAYKRGQFGKLENFNLVPGVDSFIGGKVGDTLAAGQTSVSFHKLKVKGEDRVVVIILLNSKDRVSDVVDLIDYMHERFGSYE